MSADECGFTVTNSSEKKIEFNTLLNSGMKTIYIDVLISDDELYTNNSNYNLKQERVLLRWVWTKNEMSFLLSYTEDIHAISFNLLKGAYIEDFTIDIDIFPAGCTFDYRNDTKALFHLIHDTFVQNESDWQLCHRYFENQEWKVMLFNLTSYWVGYEMECFKPSCREQLTISYRVSFKFWTLVVTVCSYLRIFYKDFYDPYNELLKMCMLVSNDTNPENIRSEQTSSSNKTSSKQTDLDDVTADNQMVSVQTYRMIANTVYPIRMQIAFMIAKLLCLSVIISVIAHVMGNDVGDDSFIDQYLPLILFTVSPAVAMKLYNKNPSEHVEKYLQFIKQTMAKSKEAKNKINVTDCGNKQKMKVHGAKANCPN
ncbi:unnamed protein product [Mytilus edulis]|uniref:Uncharacterized protein n=1 Tax=Mytilus edulis TaxID=6550 RepID=A0A8S3T5Q8_MYTED|nr:unnamed protein product [Mytilus edulis]